MLTFLVSGFKGKPYCEAIQEVGEVCGNYELTKIHFCMQIVWPSFFFMYLAYDIVWC
jgi:hypothetical protein